MSQPKGAVRAVSDLKKHAGFWLRFVSNHVVSCVRAQAAGQWGHGGEWVVLREMYGQEEMSSSELADRIWNDAPELFRSWWTGWWARRW